MSQRKTLRDIGIEATHDWYLDSPDMLGEYVAGLSSVDQALFLDGLARGCHCWSCDWERKGR